MGICKIEVTGCGDKALNLLAFTRHLLALASLGLACLTETKLVLSPKAGVESDEGTSKLLWEAFGSKSLKIVGSSRIAWNFRQTADVIGYLK